MKIGVTSQNFRTITGHAGKTRRFLVYAPDDQGRPVEVERLDLPREMSMHEFRGHDHPLFDLDVLITAGCGEGFVRRLAQHGVQVLATGETDPLTAVEKVLKGEPLPPPQPHRH
ncbi:MAG: nitrogen fixation protein [Gammaproteobacteria bacterium]|nr:MAG: nitrogen fixation protein [Gammaproteobacteria bacterium]